MILLKVVTPVKTGVTTFSNNSKTLDSAFAGMTGCCDY